jgi:hypothetical protein
MATKRARKSARRVKNLKLKSVSADKAKQVKGGPNGPPWIKQGLTSQS